VSRDVEHTGAVHPTHPRDRAGGGPSGRRRRLRTRSAGAMVLALAVPAVLAGCGGGGASSSGTATLNWYINPDNGGQTRLAASCSKASNGAYKIAVSILPTDATSQREQLVRRLAAKDTGIDLMSIDPAYIAEIANAKFLRPFTSAEAAPLTEGVLKAPVDNATFDGKLYGAPFWANTQLLWYRKSVAAAAGVDPASPSFTWDTMIDAAVKTKTTVAEQGFKYEGYAVWINSLIQSAGGNIVTDAGAGADAKVTIDSEAGKKAAAVIQKLAHSSAASPALSTDQEGQDLSLFNAANGGFMMNWGYVWQANLTAVKEGTLPQSVVDDTAWARWPAVTAGTPSKPPFGGIQLGISAFSKHHAQAVAAVDCLTSEKSQAAYMLDSGNPAARSAVYDDAAVRKAYPMADLIRTSINEAGPRPSSPFWSDISGALQSTWHPASSVNPNKSPEAAQKFIPKVLDGKALL
jgi:multiple sugar transport system substrate-binding protein